MTTYAARSESATRDSRLDLAADVGDGITTKTPSFTGVQAFDAPKFGHDIVVVDRLHS